METKKLRACLKQHHLFCILVGVSIFLCFFELGSRSLEIKDARRFAAITQEMMQDGNWLVLHKHGKIYMNKPHVLMWLIALFPFYLGFKRKHQTDSIYPAYFEIPDTIN
mgnify:FL=1